MKNEEKQESGISRRKFIKGTVISSAGLMILPRCTIGGKGYIPPSDKVNIGIIGAGEQSLFSIKQLFKLEDVQVTAIADPAEHWKNDILYSFDTGREPVKNLVEKYYSEKTPNYKMSEYEDFREMLEKEKSLDAVVCATPDNTHAYVSVPRNFNWDLWLGPTQWHPYNKLYTPVRWRDFWGFGCGSLGDFGCHDMDAASWAFNLSSPESVEVFPAGNKGSTEIAPYGEIGHFRFAAKGEQLPLKLTWYSGGLLPEHPDLLPRNTTPFLSPATVFDRFSCRFPFI